MTLYEELKARGLVAQITDEEIIDLINNGKATFYIGFDCTADSLTAGHFTKCCWDACCAESFSTSITGRKITAKRSRRS